MGRLICAVLITLGCVGVFCERKSDCADEAACVIDLSCSACLPGNMPLVSHPAPTNGSIHLTSGQRLVLSCGTGRFLNYPLVAELDVMCDAGQYRVTADLQRRPLFDLGCQESVFEDIEHEVEHCSPPMQGRAYVTTLKSGSVRHLATACFDPSRGMAQWLKTGAGLEPKPHAHRSAPLSLLGNFNHMFDANTRHEAERLYAAEESLNDRLHHRFKHHGVSFAEQRLSSAELLGAPYFGPEAAAAAQFVSNRAAVWRGVARGNLRHLQHDIGQAMKDKNSGLRVIAGTAGVARMRTGSGHVELYLRAGERFPVPRYIWTVVRNGAKAIAVVVLNEPAVAVSEVREAVFCDSVCSRASWLQELRRNRNYETPILGLAFCCDAHYFADNIQEFPKHMLDGVPRGPTGMLLEL